MSKTLLIVHHTPSPSTRELLEAVLAGANDPEIDGVDVISRPALAATLPDMLTANFGDLSGRSSIILTDTPSIGIGRANASFADCPPHPKSALPGDV